MASAAIEAVFDRANIAPGHLVPGIEYAAIVFDPERLAATEDKLTEWSNALIDEGNSFDDNEFTGRSTVHSVEIEWTYNINKSELTFKRVQTVAVSADDPFGHYDPQEAFDQWDHQPGAGYATLDSLQDTVLGVRGSLTFLGPIDVLGPSDMSSVLPPTTIASEFSGF